MEGRFKPLFSYAFFAFGEGCFDRQSKKSSMIDKQKVWTFLQEALEERKGKGLFPVSVSVSPKNEIKVYVDGMNGVCIDDCVDISRYIESHLDRDEEDFELTVSSAGLDQAFRVREQYGKNIGREVKVVTREGETFRGTLLEAGETGFSLRLLAKKVKKGALPQEAEVLDFLYSSVKETKLVITFK